MNTQISRKKLAITGLIQGVGFRPFIYNLAAKYGLPGWAANTSEGVIIDVEGSVTALDAFIDELQTASPANSKIESLTITDHPACGYQSFELRESDFVNQTALFISPDIATCDACREEIFDPSKRRFQYAFTSCSQCGPRYSIISALPYDRVRTSMHRFALCQACQDEYDNPDDRRFHAQTIACPDCGPSLELIDNAGQCIARNVEAIEQTARLINQGCIVALKGIGGFQLLADASSQSTIELLRHRKQRPDKPFAVMCCDLDQVANCAEVTALETQLLNSTAAPIVLLGKKTSCAIITEAVAPKNNRIGIMLPYSPLHHLLLGFLNRPLVATSGNVSNEPICIDNQQARSRLATIADYFLVHNRPILRPVDDSIVQQINDSKTILRAARGYAPVTITIRGNARSEEEQRNRLAVG
ncbi:MAG: carbamoyltransferase HypF, partial [Gammaproteobacteria bacterium]|nr:carbamoyltransferase HypF [Gammaproteobacteria bacterium]